MSLVLIIFSSSLIEQRTREEFQQPPLLQGSDLAQGNNVVLKSQDSAVGRSETQLYYLSRTV